MLRNSSEGWGWLSKTLHWLMAVLILVEVPVGYLMSYTYPLMGRDKDGLVLHNLFSQIHQTNGLLILALVILRLVWRLRNAVPPTPHGFLGQAVVAKLTHYGFYALLLVLPLSGWAALSAFGLAPIWFFTIPDLVPHILPQVPVEAPLGYSFFAGIHVWAYKIGVVLLIAHVVAALWHHFGLRDSVLARMWPLARVSPPSREL